MDFAVGKRLEQYTIKKPHEVLIVDVEIAQEQDRIVIFKGFSSSLMHPTAFDLDIPVIPENAQIINIDRVASPYNPESPRYIQQGLTWETIQPLLAEVGV